MIIGIDHGYYAIKTRNCSFPAGITPCGSQEPYTRQNVLTFDGCFFVCGSGRQPIQRDKTVNENYYLLTLAAIATSTYLQTVLAGYRLAGFDSKAVLQAAAQARQAEQRMPWKRCDNER